MHISLPVLLKNSVTATVRASNLLTFLLGWLKILKLMYFVGSMFLQRDMIMFLRRVKWKWCTVGTRRPPTETSPLFVRHFPGSRAHAASASNVLVSGQLSQSDVSDLRIVRAKISSLGVAHVLPSLWTAETCYGAKQT